ncbi:MAG: hypothetical protein Q7V19_07975, partial [Bacteroidales bacterium]|nr:hypothetical protein [Bacteroidales bacterium]
SVITSDDEKSAKGVVVFSILQNNNCFGGDSAYITLSYEYFSKANIPASDAVNLRKVAFDKVTIDNHKLTTEHIHDGLLNTHDKEFLSCTELINGNSSQSYYYYYFIKYKCKGFAKGAVNEIFDQQPNEYQYTDIYLTAIADEAVSNEEISLIFNGTFSYDEAQYHTKQLLDVFLSLDFKKVAEKCK